MHNYVIIFIVFSQSQSQFKVGSSLGLYCIDLVGKFNYLTQINFTQNKMFLSSHPPSILNWLPLLKTNGIPDYTPIANGSLMVNL